MGVGSGVITGVAVGASVGTVEADAVTAGVAVTGGTAVDVCAGTLLGGTTGFLSVIVTVIVPIFRNFLLNFSNTVIFAFPTFFAVIFPFLEIVAMDFLELL